MTDYVYTFDAKADVWRCPQLGYSACNEHFRIALALADQDVRQVRLRPTKEPLGIVIETLRQTYRLMDDEEQALEGYTHIQVLPA